MSAWCATRLWRRDAPSHPLRTNSSHLLRRTGLSRREWMSRLSRNDTSCCIKNVGSPITPPPGPRTPTTDLLHRLMSKRKQAAATADSAEKLAKRASQSKVLECVRVYLEENLPDDASLTEKCMFGMDMFMVRGNMFIGVGVRASPKARDQLARIISAVLSYSRLTFVFCKTVPMVIPVAPSETAKDCWFERAKRLSRRPSQRERLAWRAVRARVVGEFVRLPISRTVHLFRPVGLVLYCLHSCWRTHQGSPFASLLCSLRYPNGRRRCLQGRRKTEALVRYGARVQPHDG